MNGRLLLGAAVLLLALLAGPACSPGPGSRDARPGNAGTAGKLPVLAEVDGTILTQADLVFETRLLHWVKKAVPEEKESAGLLEELIDRVLILKRADVLGLKPSRADLDTMIQDASQGTKLNDFKAALAEQGILFPDWEEALSQRWRVARTVENEVLAKVKLNPGEVKDYYWEHLSDFRRKDRLSLRQIVTATKPEADRALQEVLLGLPFAEAAKKYSRSPEAPLGGDLGWVSRADLPASLANVAFNLKKGKPSGVFRSPYGFHVILVEGAQPARLATLEEASPAIERTLREERQQRPFREWLLSLRKRAKIVRYVGNESKLAEKPEVKSKGGKKK
jgi:parvulin-like peptidyl-prolyl isomerase